MMAAGRRRQVLEVRELAAGRGVLEVRRKLAELAGGRRIAACRGGLGGALQVGRDLAGDLREFGWIRLLKLLEFGRNLGERRKLAVIRLRFGGRRAAALGVFGCTRQAGALEHGAEDRL